MGQAGIDDTLTQVFQNNRAAVLKLSEAPEAMREPLKKQGIQHIVVLPVPPFAEVTLPEVLVRLPIAVPVTFTETVQGLPSVAMAPPCSEP